MASKSINVKKLFRRQNVGKPVAIIQIDQGEQFQYQSETATAGQTTFTASFPINMVFKNSVLVTTGYTGRGTNQIIFTAGLLLGDEVYLTT